MGKRVAHKGKGFFGETIYYDENYNEIGRTAKGFIGYDVYDKDLNKVGHATDNFWDGKNYYDADYNKIGSENKAPIIGHNQYDASYNKIGHSGPNILGGETMRGNHPVNQLLDNENDYSVEEDYDKPNICGISPISSEVTTMTNNETTMPYSNLGEINSMSAVTDAYVKEKNLKSKKILGWILLSIITVFFFLLFSVDI